MGTLWYSFPSRYPLETSFHGDQTQRDLSEEAVCQARCANTERGRWEGVPYGLCDERRTHTCAEEMCREAHLVQTKTNKQNSKTLECCYSAQAKSSRNHRSTEYPVSMKWGEHSGGRLWPCLGGASSWEWSLQTVPEGAGWRKLYTPAEGRPEGANLFLTWLLYCSKINSKDNMLLLWMMDGTWSIALVLNLGQRRSLKYGSQKSILQQWWAKRKGRGKKTVFYCLG